jgi:hypothetical protein
MHYVIDAFYPNPKGSGRRLRIAKEKEACSCQSEKSPLEGKEQRAETQYVQRQKRGERTDSPVQRWTYSVSAHFSFQGDFSPFHGFSLSEGIQGSGNKWLTYYHLLSLLAFYSCR